LKVFIDYIISYQLYLYQLNKEFIRGFDATVLKCLEMLVLSAYME